MDREMEEKITKVLKALLQCSKSPEFKEDCGDYPGYPVTQLVYMDAVDVSRPYNGKYNGQIEAIGSRMQLDGITPDNAMELGRS